MSDSTHSLLTSEELHCLLSLTSSELEAALELIPAEHRETVIQLLIEASEQLTAGPVPIDHASIPWESWLRQFLPDYVASGFSERHRRFWAWIESIEDGEYIRPRVEAWPRGGSKSTSAELAVARLGVKLARRFVLYVSETQDQADRHVMAIGGLLGLLGVRRAVDTYGRAQGWRRSQLRTATGFNVAAIGLDTASRGIKLDQFRPDMIILDDVDNRTDSPRTVDKKIDAITSTIIPAGSADCIVLMIQNLIHEDSIASRLVDNRAEFLLDREPPIVEPAIEGLQYRIVERDNGPNQVEIIGGRATWQGQSLEVCQAQMNKWGIKTFLRESQHELHGESGYFFDVTKLRSIDADAVPELERICLSWDLAATEGAGDNTSGVLIGRSALGKYYIPAVIAGQWSADRVKSALRLCNDFYRSSDAAGVIPYDPKRLKIHLPQDPGQAGKVQAGDLKREFSGASVVSVTGSKATRAKDFAEQVNLGNVYLVNLPLPGFLSKPASGKPLLMDLSYQTWQREFREELRRFREDARDQMDDRIDAASDGFNDIKSKAPALFAFG